MDMGPSSTAETPIGPLLPEHAWVLPILDTQVLDGTGDPAELAVQRDSIRLAFVAALQHLPARQRAVLILRDVLRWQAAEVAELLDSSLASVHSALQRARATMAERDVAAVSPSPETFDQQELLDRYVDAFERYDIDSLVSLLHEDVVMSMPPFDLWLRGPANMARWFTGQGSGCRGSRLVPAPSNGGLGFGSYKIDPSGGWYPFAIQVIEVGGGKITGHHNFLEPDLFTAFGLPSHLD
jgi:RNA polymerase sigma-70 factor (ECF subfamily)